MAAQRFLFVGVRCVETLSRVVLGAEVCFLGVVLQKMALQPRTVTLKLQRSRAMPIGEIVRACSIPLRLNR